MMYIVTAVRFEGFCLSSFLDISIVIHEGSIDYTFHYKFYHCILPVQVYEYERCRAYNLHEGLDFSFVV